MRRCSRRDSVGCCSTVSLRCSIAPRRSAGSGDLLVAAVEELGQEKSARWLGQVGSVVLDAFQPGVECVLVLEVRQLLEEVEAASEVEGFDDPAEVLVSKGAPAAAVVEQRRERVLDRDAIKQLRRVVPDVVRGMLVD